MARHRPAGHAAYRDGFFTVSDGLRLHFRDYGEPSDRPPLLCLHGLTRNARDFHDFALRIAGEHRVLVLEFRGRGESARDPQPARYLPLTYVHDVVALLDHVGIADAVVVGTSLGGIVAMLLAVIDEDRIAATILNDVGPELSSEGLERIRGYVGEGRAFASWAEAAAAAKAINRGFPRAWGGDEWERMARRLSSERDDGTIRADYDPAIAEPFRDASGAASVDMWPLFEALAKKPVLVLRGGESDLLTADAAAAMASRSASVTLVTVPGVAHAPDLDEPEAVAAIDEFLARIGA